MSRYPMYQPPMNGYYPMLRPPMPYPGMRFGPPPPMNMNRSYMGSKTPKVSSVKPKVYNFKPVKTPLKAAVKVPEPV